MTNIEKLADLFLRLQPEVSYLRDDLCYVQSSKIVRVDLTWSLSSGFIRPPAIASNIKNLEKLTEMIQDHNNVLVTIPGRRKWKFQIWENFELKYTAIIKFTESSMLNDWALKRKYKHLLR